MRRWLILALLGAVPQILSAQSPSYTASPFHPAIKDPLSELRKNPAKLIEKKFDQLSDKTLGEPGHRALAGSQEWRQGETDHFVIHFLRLTEGQRLGRESEFYYAKVKLDLSPAKDLSHGKSHIFLFDREENWEKFRAQIHVPGWTAGVTIGDEFFLGAFPGNANLISRAEHIMAHELTHLVLNRFLSKPLPLWLNEGFAEYQADDAYRKLKGIAAGPARPASPHKMVLSELTVLTGYPKETKQVADFYDESGRLVKFLLEKNDKRRFVTFLYTMTTGESFQKGILQTYSSQYKRFSDFETAYKSY